MTLYGLPKSAVIDGVEYELRSDYRAVLDIIEVMGDATASDEERALVVLSIFYPEFEKMPISSFKEAIDYCIWFIDGGEKPAKIKKPKLMDWSQDFQLVVAPVNKVLGFEVRDVEYLHWWTFLAAYREIGDCLFAQIVGIRSKRANGKKLDKADQQFYKEHRDLIDLKVEKTASEMAILETWT